MKTIFADTSYYIALLTPTDRWHQRALAVTGAYDGCILTTAWVLLELGSYFAPTLNRRAFLQLVSTLQEDRDVLAVPSNSDDFHAGLTLFSQRLDKSWSLVDCISFNTMRAHGIIDAWTTDHHFQQAGFNALLT
jgi:uncharacterized protein